MQLRYAHESRVSCSVYYISDKNIFSSLLAATPFSPFEVDILEVWQAPVKGVKYEKVIPGTDRVEKDDELHAEDIPTCSIS